MHSLCSNYRNTFLYISLYIVCTAFLLIVTLPQQRTCTFAVPLASGTAVRTESHPLAELTSVSRAMLFSGDPGSDASNGFIENLLNAANQQTQAVISVPNTGSVTSASKTFSYSLAQKLRSLELTSLNDTRRLHARTFVDDGDDKE